MVLELDSTTAVALIQGLLVDIAHRNLVLLISELIVRAWDVRIVHAGREANGVADLLAKIMRNTEDLVRVFLEPPNAVRILLDRDKSIGLA